MNQKDTGFRLEVDVGKASLDPTSRSNLHSSRSLYGFQLAEKVFESKQYLVDRLEDSKRLWAAESSRSTEHIMPVRTRLLVPSSDEAAIAVIDSELHLRRRWYCEDDSLLVRALVHRIPYSEWQYCN